MNTILADNWESAVVSPETVIGKIAGAIQIPVGALAKRIDELQKHKDKTMLVAGLGGIVIFVPQIAMLFGLISLLEQSGYLARAAFALDRSLRRFGLSGWSFLPALTAHACAIPAIMGTRLIAEPRDRLATVLALPFFSCAARLPVYALLTSLLFPENPTAQAIAFVACYVLGGLVGLGTVALLRFFHLRRPPAPFMMELPPWCRPSIKAAVGESARRSGVFLKKAGTVILAIGIGLWVLTAFPRVEAA